MEEIIKKIVGLSWGTYNPIDIGYSAIVTGIEFAESLEIAARNYHDHAGLKEVVMEELWTNNLTYEHYIKSGHHCHFLIDFYTTKGLYREVSSTVIVAGSEYLSHVRSLTDEERAMTIFSREKELPEIFKEILKAHPWKDSSMGFYEYYLEEHIRLDGSESGHASMVKDFTLNQTVLKEFYSRRLELYESMEPFKRILKYL